MISYQVSDQIFFNPYRAFLYASKHCPHESPNLIIDDVFDKSDWTQNPQESIIDLLDRRAIQIAKKYDRIILAFSGGTDSTTVYNTLLRNGIFIDEILISYTPDNELHPMRNVEWIQKNHPDPRTKITVFDRYESRWNDLFDQEDWVLNNCGGYRRFELGAPGPYFYSHCEETWGNSNWCLLTGLEKPHIKKHNGQWCAVHLDKVYQAGMNWPKFEYFFVTPDLPNLHIKQNHMLLSYIKSNYHDAVDGWSSIEKLGKKDHVEYSEFAQACGCDIEINLGVSFWQKKINNQFCIDNVTSLMNNQFCDLTKVEHILRHKLINKDSRALKYIQGWQSLQSDQTLIAYMVARGLLDNSSQSVRDYNGVWGKYYPLEA